MTSPADLRKLADAPHLHTEDCRPLLRQAADEIERLANLLDTEEAQYDDLSEKVHGLCDLIAHGDEPHKKWLYDCISEHFADHWVGDGEK
jgi:hypothetical protein